MVDHYYSDVVDVKSNPQTMEARLLGETFNFITDNGVFSKNKVDYGSQVLLETVASQVHIGEKVLEIGCGYGPIGLGLAKVDSSKSVHMTDVNERALHLAQKNAEINLIENVLIYKSSVFEHVEEKNFQAIISNPPIRAGKRVVHQILKEAYDYLDNEGQLFIVIQRKQGAPSAKKKMKEVYGNVERLALDKGYWVLVSTKKEA